MCECEFHEGILITRPPEVVTCVICERSGPPGELTTDDPYFGEWAHEECWPEFWRQAGFPDGCPPWLQPNRLS